MSDSKQTQPDFEPAVKVILAVFAAFTGFTISKSIDALVDPKNLDLSSLDWTLKFFCALLESYQFWILVAVLSLLLRYIIGSAIHLNHVYVEQVPVDADANKRPEILLELPPGVHLGQNGSLPIQIEGQKMQIDFPISVLLVQKAEDRKEPRSKCIRFLFKDFIFLVIFGVLAVFIAKSSDFSTLAFRSILYLAAGLAWGLVDWLTRDVFEWGGERERSSKVWGHETGWLVMDIGQIIVTLLIAAGHYLLSQFYPHPVTDFWAALVLALIYGIFLYLDIKMLLVPPEAPAQP